MNKTSPLFLNNAEQQTFAAGLPTHALGKSLLYLHSTGSTNDAAAQMAKTGAPHGLLVITDKQTAGRGRHGRSWSSPQNKALLFSLVIRLQGFQPQRLGWMALAAGLSVLEGIEALERASTRTRIPLALKWPNDIVVPTAAPASPTMAWRKLGGILCEGSLSTALNESGYVIMGIGLNVLQTRAELPTLAKAEATSLHHETKTTWARKDLLGHILTALESNLDQLGTEPGFGAVSNHIEQRLALWWKGRTLVLRTSQSEIHGRFDGLDAFGRLRIVDGQGKGVALADAEVLAVTPDG